MPEYKESERVEGRGGEILAFSASVSAAAVTHA